MAPDLRQLTPFAAAAALAFALVATTAKVEPAQFLAALALAFGVLAMALWLPLRVLPALLFLLSAALLRNCAGGTGSGVSSIALLPVFWIALHGTRAQLVTVLGGAAVYFLAPIVLIGGDAYPTTGYRTAVIFVVVSSIIGVAVQRLVERVRSHADDLEHHRRDFERVAAVSRRIATTPDARVEVCRAACEISGATFAVLLEPEGDDRLLSTAMAGLDAAPFRSAPAPSSPPVVAMTTGRPLFIEDAASSPILNRELWAEHGSPASMLFEPVVRGSSAVGVLLVGWAERVSDTRRTSIVSLLATEAAIAIERADLVQQLSGLALTDPLTGVPNRRAWDLELDSVLAEARGAHRPVCVAMLDLDHFKAFNDGRGHQAGDRLLKEAAAAWRAVLRPADILARYGGEEFAVLLPDCSADAALAVLERLREATPSGETCSAGVAQWDGAETPDELVERADAALYVAKGAGRDRIATAS